MKKSWRKVHRLAMDDCDLTVIFIAESVLVSADNATYYIYNTYQEFVDEKGVCKMGAA